MKHEALTKKQILDKARIKQRFETYAKRNEIKSRKETGTMYDRKIESYSDDEMDLTRNSDFPGVF